MVSNTKGQTRNGIKNNLIQTSLVISTKHISSELSDNCVTHEENDNEG